MVRLPPLFSDHMVLQQGKYLPIWGEGSGKVCARLGAHQAYTLCEEGHWRLILPPIPAGGPYTLTVQDENSSVHITDVMIGEVWLAAGQSNMEQPTFAVEEGLTRAAEGANSRIRFFTVPRRTRPDFTGHRWHFGSVAAVDTGWSVCTEETITAGAGGANSRRHYKLQFRRLGNRSMDPPGAYSDTSGTAKGAGAV